jgi:hypothetical protein
MVTGKKRATFEATVNAILAAGAEVVSGTSDIAMTSHRKRDGEPYLQSRYSIVLTGEPACFAELDDTMEG